MEINDLITKVKIFHNRFGFEIGTKNINTLLYRQNLLMEELGEISQCITKGKGDLAEEHADLLILLIGNCVLMDIDIETAVNQKLFKIMQRPVKNVNGIDRVSEWENEA